MFQVFGQVKPGASIEVTRTPSIQDEYLRGRVGQVVKITPQLDGGGENWTVKLVNGLELTWPDECFRLT